MEYTIFQHKPRIALHYEKFIKNLYYVIVHFWIKPKTHILSPASSRFTYFRIDQSGKYNNLATQIGLSDFNS